MRRPRRAIPDSHRPSQRGVSGFTGGRGFAFVSGSRRYFPSMMPPTPAPSDPNVAPAPVSVEDSLRRIWEKNGTFISAVCVAIILVIIAKGGWDYIVARKEVETRRDYATCTTAEA